MNKEMLREGRAYIINGLVAYAEAFDLLSEAEIPTAMEELETSLEMLESVIPVLKSVWELECKFGSEKSFLEWLVDAAKRKGFGADPD